MHQEDETQNTIAINRTVDAIALGPQYNRQVGYFFETLLTGERLRRSHWTPVNMTEDVIEWYDTFNTNFFPEDLIFGELNDQTIPSTYSDITNEYDNDGTKIDADLTDNEGVEDSVVPSTHLTSSITRCPLWSHSTVHSKNIHYFVGINPQLRKKLFEVCDVCKTILRGIKQRLTTVR